MRKGERKTDKVVGRGHTECFRHVTNRSKKIGN